MSRSRPRVAAALVLLLACAASPASAQEAADPHAAQPERPTVATHAGTVATGWLEIESGIESDRFGDRSRAFSTPTTLKLGLAPRLQLSVWGAWQRQSPVGAPSSTGVGDLSVGTKWRLLEDAPVVGDFAVLPSVKLPTGDRSSGTGTGTTDASLLLISSHDLHGVALDINAGATWRRGAGDAAPPLATLWTVSLGIPLRGPLGLAAECFGAPGTGGPAGAGPSVALLAGPTVTVRPWLVLDVGVIAPLEGSQPRALYSGLVWNVGRMW